MSTSDPHAALKNIIKTNDYTEAAEMVMARVQKEKLMKLYLVQEFNTCEEFLAYLSKRYGRYKKGGVPDIQAAAKILVDDWNK